MSYFAIWIGLSIGAIGYHGWYLMKWGDAGTYVGAYGAALLAHWLAVVVLPRALA